MTRARTTMATRPTRPTRPTRTKRGKPSRVLLYVALTVMALVFVFPFYYMAIGAFQENPTTTPSALLPTSDWTLQNFARINERIDLGRTLLNSAVFTVGVLAGTLVFGLLAGYALSRLEWRGRGALFVVILGVQMVPFQLLMIPLYVQIAGFFGLGDSYAGMILPFLINTQAVFIFRQFFLSLPEQLFEAARIDGAGEVRILWSIAIPMVKPAIATVALITFIGPWNEFLWPFLITKDTSMQPLAVALSNYITNVAGNEANPNGAILAGACALAFPVVIIFCLFQRHFQATNIGAALKG